jgi:hypothetical protein
MHRTLWMLLHITDLIHPVRKLTACRYICEDYVARKGKEISRELVAVSCASPNVKFHHRELVPSQNLAFIIALVLKPLGSTQRFRTKAISRIVQVSQARMSYHLRFCFNQPTRSNVAWKPSMPEAFPQPSDLDLCHQ